MSRPFPRSAPPVAGPQTGLARALSKLGFCSRSQAWDLIAAGNVRLNGVVCRNPERPVNLQGDRFEVAGQSVCAEAKVYLALNKPRGLITSASDEQGRDTVFTCFNPPSHASAATSALPRHLVPVGRLDKASEGLLLFTNDSAWSARLTDPSSHLDKTYHVQVNCVADDNLVRGVQVGVRDEGEWLAVKAARVLRQGEKNSWLELVLDEGRNRHLRRLLAALGVEVLRLVRVAIGPLELGMLGKGQWRELTPEEVAKLHPNLHSPRPPARPPATLEPQS
jgi:23S rRNA pseudouridine2605 synthase